MHRTSKGDVISDLEICRTRRALRYTYTLKRVNRHKPHSPLARLAARCARPGPQPPRSAPRSASGGAACASRERRHAQSGSRIRYNTSGRCHATAIGTVLTLKVKERA